MAELTGSEKRVLEALCRDASSNRELGRTLYLEEDTVKTHLKHIFRKKGFRNRQEAISWGRENGYGQSQDSAQTPDSTLPFDRLGARLYKIVELVAQGKTNQEIADELRISPLTVKSDLAQIGRILGESNRVKVGKAYNTQQARNTSQQ